MLQKILKKILRYWKSGPYKKVYSLKVVSSTYCFYSKSIHEKYGYYDKNWETLLILN